MKVEPLSFYELARASHIKRWHIVNTANQQNVAEHSYNVTVIGLELYRLLTGEELTVLFILSLLFHDSPEIRYGDIPTPGKNFMRSVLPEATPGDVFEYMDSIVMPTIPYTCEPCVSISYQEMIHVADTIEAYWWISENGVGAHARAVAEKSRRALISLVNRLDWHDQVNRVLERLGLPYISRDMEVTPP